MAVLVYPEVDSFIPSGITEKIIYLVATRDNDCITEHLTPKQAKALIIALEGAIENVSKIGLKK